MSAAPFRVFLVEDSASMQELMEQLLVRVGPFAIVGTARSELEATDWLQQHPGEWDLAIVDLVLAMGSGFNVLRRCEEFGAGAKAIVASNYLSPAVALKCGGLGADASFSKDDLRGLTAYLQAFRV